MDEINLKDIWQSQKTESPDSKEIILKAITLQKKTRIKIILVNLLLFVTMVLIIGIVWYYQPKMITTKIGTILVVIAIIMQIIASGKLIPLLKKGSTETSNAEYMQGLLLIKKKQAFLQSTIMNLYFILLGAGLLLYMIEYTVNGSLLKMLLIYGATIGWIAFNWFYTRKRTIRKQQVKLDEAINNLEAITVQFSEGD